MIEGMKSLNIFYLSTTVYLFILYFVSLIFYLNAFCKYFSTLPTFSLLIVFFIHFLIITYLLCSFTLCLLITFVTFFTTFSLFQHFPTAPTFFFFDFSTISRFFKFLSFRSFTHPLLSSSSLFDFLRRYLHYFF